MFGGPVPMAGFSASAEGEVALYDKVKEYAELAWDFILCKVGLCEEEEYDSLHEEKEEARHSVLEEFKNPHKNKATEAEEVKLEFNTIEDHLATKEDFSELEMEDFGGTTQKLPLDDYPRNDIFLLKSKAKLILARIRESKLTIAGKFLLAQKKWKQEDLDNNAFKSDPNVKDLVKDQDLLELYEQRYALFSEYRNGILLDQNDWNSTIPEIGAEHIARRIGSKFRVVLDAFCGAGSAAIQVQ